MKPSRLVSRLAVLLAWIGCAAACSAPKDPVHALLDELQAAAEARDAARVVDRVSPQFQGTGGMSRDEARATLQRYFAAYESVQLGLNDVEVKDAHGVVLRVAFAGRPRQIGGLAGLLPSTAQYRFELSLAEESGRSVITAASWEAVQPKEP